MGLIDEIVHAVAPEQILFEAPRKDQQVWFVRRFGAERQPRQHRRPTTSSRWRRSGSGCASDTAAGGARLSRVAGHRARAPRRDRRQPRADPRAGVSRHAAERHRTAPGRGAGRAGRVARRRSPRCGLRISAARARLLRSSARGSGSSRASTRGCARRTAATGRASCSSTSSASEPELYAAWLRAGRALPLSRRRVAAASSRTECSQRSMTIEATGELPALVVCHGGSIRVVLCARRSPRARRVSRVRDPERGGGAAVRRLPLSRSRRSWSRRSRRSSSPST